MLATFDRALNIALIICPVLMALVSVQIVVVQQDI